MNWNEHILFEVNDLFEFEPEILDELEHIDRASAVKGIIGTRIKRHFAYPDNDKILSKIKNPEVLRQPAIFLNLHLVFNANAGDGRTYREKAEYYLDRFEESIRQAMTLLELDGFSSKGVMLVR